MIRALGLGSGEDPREGHGIELLNTMVRRFQVSGITVPSFAQPPEGPHFNYEAAPSIFPGCSGSGPLHAALDTNLLIDYFTYGTQLWAGESLPDEVPGAYGEELEGFQLIVALWVLRDIRFTVPRLFLRDSKRKPIPPDRRAQHRDAMLDFQRAIQLVADSEGSDGPRPRVMQRSDEALFAYVPEGNDRALVREAAGRGMHVFLTRDQGVLAARPAMRLLGLLVASPLDLFEELMAAGAFHCMIEPRAAYWPMPDQQRVVHLLDALGRRGAL